LGSDPERRKRWLKPDARLFRGLRHLRTPRGDEESQSAHCSLTFSADLGAAGLEGFFGRTLDGGWGKTSDVRVTAKGLVDPPAVVPRGSVVRFANECQSSVSVLIEQPNRGLIAQALSVDLGNWVAFRFLKPGRYRIDALCSSAPPMMLDVQ
jgi:hypothetical protein